MKKEPLPKPPEPRQIKDYRGRINSWWDRLFNRKKGRITRQDLISDSAINQLRELNTIIEKLSQRPKYEFYLLSGSKVKIDRETKELQEKGWELAGNITPYTGNFDFEGMLIPFKRKL